MDDWARGHRHGYTIVLPIVHHTLSGPESQLVSRGLRGINCSLEKSGRGINNLVALIAGSVREGYGSRGVFVSPSSLSSQ